MKVFAILFASSALSRPQIDSNNSTDYDDYTDVSIDVRKFSALTVSFKFNFKKDVIFNENYFRQWLSISSTLKEKLT